jgi:hypothetical protein
MSDLDDADYALIVPRQVDDRESELLTRLGFTLTPPAFSYTPKPSLWWRYFRDTAAEEKTAHDIIAEIKRVGLPF